MSYYISETAQVSLFSNKQRQKKQQQTVAASISGIVKRDIL